MNRFVAEFIGESNLCMRVLPQAVRQRCSIRGLTSCRSQKHDSEIGCCPPYAIELQHASINPTVSGENPGVVYLWSTLKYFVRLDNWLDRFAGGRLDTRRFFLKATVVASCRRRTFTSFNVSALKAYARSEAAAAGRAAAVFSGRCSSIRWLAFCCSASRALASSVREALFDGFYVTSWSTRSASR